MHFKISSVRESLREKITQLYKTGGVRGLAAGALRYSYFRSVQPVIKSLIQPSSIFIHTKLNSKLNVFTEDWDLLIVLDTCRPDALRQVADEYNFINEVESRWSVGSQSAEWIANTFDQYFSDKIKETAYITSNPHVRTVFENKLKKNHNMHNKKRISRIKKFGGCPVATEQFSSYIPLYDVSIDNPEFTCPDPRAVTDHTIMADRKGRHDRIIAHYMPPHTPYIATVSDGEVKFLDVARNASDFNAYIDNLRWALEEIKLLINNVDRERTIITSDHGENFNLRSIRPNHEPGMIDPSVRRVPWVETTATNSGNYEPDITDEENTTEVTDVLESLGYL
jgi:hypothetical protein